MAASDGVVLVESALAGSGEEMNDNANRTEIFGLGIKEILQ